MSVWQKTNLGSSLQNQLSDAQGQQAMGGGGYVGGLGSGYVGGLGSGYAQTAISSDPERDSLRMANHALQSQVQAFDSIRAQDRVLLQRHYRIWQWLKDVHPEVIEEFKAVEDLLKASGETF